MKKTISTLAGFMAGVSALRLLFEILTGIPRDKSVVGLIVFTLLFAVIWAATREEEEVSD